MLSVTHSMGLYGIDGFTVTSECSISDGPDCFEIVGLPDNSVKEAEQRLRAAFENSALPFPENKTVINLAPADRRKEGSSLDLAMAIGILKASGLSGTDWDVSRDVFIGELSFTGELRGVRGVLSMTLCARECGFARVFVPKENCAEAAAVSGIAVYPVESLIQLIMHLTGEREIPCAHQTIPDFSYAYTADMDFSQVKGQKQARRAVEIAAAGGHNVLMIGSPGAGKSMIAKRIPTIMPTMTFEESVEVTKIHSCSGQLSFSDGLVTRRPFRSPHHTMSAPSLVGGGRIPMPGEISLASEGVLFLDELPEFSKNVTESMRQPLEDGEVTVTRTMGRVTFPSRLMLVCAMNPCRCGYYGAPGKRCTCSPADIKKYLSKISGPLLDRIDIQIELPPLTFEELSSETLSESSADIRLRVEAAREIAKKRFGRGDACNAKMTRSEISLHCRVDTAGQKLLENAFEKMGMSARGYDRVLRVARTVADLGGSEKILPSHIAEAIQLRSLDKKYFGN